MRIHTSDGVGHRTVDSRIVFASVIVVVVITVVALVLGGRRCALTLSLPLGFGRSRSYSRQRTATRRVGHNVFACGDVLFRASALLWRVLWYATGQRAGYLGAVAYVDQGDRWGSSWCDVVVSVKREEVDI